MRYGDLDRSLLELSRRGARLRRLAPGRIAKARAALAGSACFAGDALERRFQAVGRLLREKAFFPPRGKRRDSPEFRALRRELLLRQDLPCLICGVRHSTLDVRAKNVFGAVQMELHHWVERRLAGAVSVRRFNERVLPELAARWPGELPRRMSKREILAWVDHGRRNVWVLCDVHHRHRQVGVHAAPYPAWLAQGFVAERILKRMARRARQGAS